MTEISMATVRSHAAYNGLNLVSTSRAEANDRWWLSSANYFVTTEPGKSLAEIDAVLDDIDGGEWKRREAERQAERDATLARVLGERDGSGEDEDGGGEDEDGGGEAAAVPF